MFSTKSTLRGKIKAYKCTTKIKWSFETTERCFEMTHEAVQLGMLDLAEALSCPQIRVPIVFT